MRIWIGLFLNLILLLSSISLANAQVDWCGDSYDQDGDGYDNPCPYGDEDRDGYPDIVDCALTADGAGGWVETGFYGNPTPNGHVRTIIPGSAVGRANGDIKICQNDGTWGEWVAYPSGYTEPGRTGGHYYVSKLTGDDTTGDGSFAKPFKTTWPISKDYLRTDPAVDAPNAHEISTDDTIYFLNGTYDDVITYSNNTKVLLYSDSKHRVMLRNYPGHSPVFDGGDATAVDECIHFYRGSEPIVIGLAFTNCGTHLKFRENIYGQKASLLATARSNYFYGSLGTAGGRNLAAVWSDGGTNYDVQRNLFVDVFSKTAPNNTNQAAIYRSEACDDAKYPCLVRYNTVILTSDHYGSGNIATYAVKIKHHAKGNRTYEEISYNNFYGGESAAIATAASPNVHHNVIYSVGDALEIADLGGENEFSLINFHHNTILPAVGSTGIHTSNDNSLNSDAYGHFRNHHNIYSLNHTPSWGNRYIWTDNYASAEVMAKLKSFYSDYNWVYNQGNSIDINFWPANDLHSFLIHGEGNHEIVFTAVKPGGGGDNITVTITQNATLSVSVSGNDITINANTSAHTVNDVIAKITETPAAAALIVAEIGHGSGEGAIELLSQTNLDHGDDSGTLYGFSVIQAAGLETHSRFTDPQLDSDYIPATAGANNMGVWADNDYFECGGGTTKWSAGLVWPNGIEPGDASICPTDHTCYYVDCDATVDGTGTYANPYWGFETVLGYTSAGSYYQGVVTSSNDTKVIIYVRGVCRYSDSVNSSTGPLKQIIEWREIGNVDDPVVIKSYPGEPQAIFDGQGFGQKAIDFNNSKASILLENIRVTDWTQSGIHMGFKTLNVDINSVTVDNIYGDGNAGTVGPIIVFQREETYAQTALLRNSWFHSNDKNPIGGSANRGTVRLHGDTTNHPDSLFTVQNVVIDGGAYCFQNKWEGGQMLVKDSICSNASGMIYARAHEIEFDSVIFNDITRLDPLDKTSVYGMEILNEVETINIHDCIFYNYAGKLITTNDTADNIVINFQNNIISNTAYTERPIYIAPWSSNSLDWANDITFGGNIWNISSQTQNEFSWTEGNGYSLSEFNTLVEDTTSILADPEFNNPTNNNFDSSLDIGACVMTAEPEATLARLFPINNFKNRRKRASIWKYLQ